MTDIDIQPKRGPGRPPLRPDSSRPSLRDRLRDKTRRYTVNSDKFFIPQELKDAHPDVSFEWKRESVYGQSDPYYLAEQRNQGWEPVDADDMPGLTPPGHQGPIIREGLVLMARPAELTKQARDEVLKQSRRQINDREKQLGIAPNGHAERTAPAIDKQIMRPVPVEE